MKIETRQKMAGLISVLIMLINLIRHLLFLSHILSYRALWGSMVTNASSTRAGEWIYAAVLLVALSVTFRMARRSFVRRHKQRLVCTPPSTGLWTGNILAAVLVFLSAVACARSTAPAVRFGWGFVMWFHFVIEIYFLYTSFLRKRKAKKIVQKRRHHR